jgi:hypothetical protein
MWEKYTMTKYTAGLGDNVYILYIIPQDVITENINIKNLRELSQSQERFAPRFKRN